MEVLGFHIVDVVIVALIAFLAIKGLLNGFSKELLNFITIVAGVILAARYNTQLVQLINEQQLVPTIPDDFSKIVGFILIVISIWLIVGLISSILDRLTAGPVSFISRIIGYILSATRYLFIFSLIIFGISQSKFFAKSATKFKTETQLFKPMSEIGMSILNLDANQSITETIKQQFNQNSAVKEESNLTNEVNLSAKISPEMPIDNNDSSY